MMIMTLLEKWSKSPKRGALVVNWKYKDLNCFKLN